MKNTIYLIIIVVCLVLAAVIFFATRSGGPAGIESIPEGELTWVMCNNPDCKARYQMPLREFFKQIEERMRANPTMMQTPALVCKDCQEESVYRAVKCPKCEHMFFYGNPNDFNDRCPECGYSQMEEDRKRAREARQAR